MSVEQFNRARELEDVLQKNVEVRYLRSVDRITNGLRNDLLDEMISCADGEVDQRTASVRAVGVLSQWKMLANSINRHIENGQVASLRKIREVLVDSASMLKKENSVPTGSEQDRNIRQEDSDNELGASLEKIFGKDMLNAVNTVANQLRNDIMAGMIPKQSGFGQAWPRQFLESWKTFGEAMYTRHTDGNLDDTALVKNVMSGAVKRLMKDIQIDKKQEVVRT